MGQVDDVPSFIKRQIGDGGRWSLSLDKENGELVQTLVPHMEELKRRQFDNSRVAHSPMSPTTKAQKHGGFDGFNLLPWMRFSL